MQKISLENLEIIQGGNFMDGFCTGVAVFDAGVGLAVLAGATIATGGAAAWIWGGANAACAGYAVYQLAN